MWISRVSNSKIGQWCSFTSIFWKKCCYFLHFIGDSLVAVFRLWNWWKGKNVKECFTFHYITTIFSIRTMNATDIWLVPNVKAKLHQNDLDWKKKKSAIQALCVFLTCSVGSNSHLSSYMRPLPFDLLLVIPLE